MPLIVLLRSQLLQDTFSYHNYECDVLNGTRWIVGKPRAVTRVLYRAGRVLVSPGIVPVGYVGRAVMATGVEGRTGHLPALRASTQAHGRPPRTTDERSTHTLVSPVHLDESQMKQSRDGSFILFLYEELTSSDSRWNYVLPINRHGNRLKVGINVF